jgi:hypothetical protein
MSLDATKSRIYCDSTDCAQDTPFPILMNSASAEAPVQNGTKSSAAGWVFVAGTYEVRHYCPDCGSKVLSSRAA